MSSSDFPAPGSAADQRLREVTITYAAPDGFPAERRFTDLTIDDLVFLFGALHARSRRTHRGRAEATRLLEDAQRHQMAWHADQHREALMRGLGGWRWLLPPRVRARVERMLTARFQESTAQWCVELADLYGRVDGLENRMVRVAAALPDAKTPVGPSILCSDRQCGEMMPLAPGVLLPGWTQEEGRVRCPKHSASLAEARETYLAGVDSERLRSAPLLSDPL